MNLKCLLGKHDFRECYRKESLEVCNSRRLENHIGIVYGCTRCDKTKYERKTEVFILSDSISSLLKFMTYKKEVGKYQQTNCASAGICNGIDDVINIVRKAEHMNYIDGIEYINNCICENDGIDNYLYPPNRRVSFYSYAYAKGIDIALGWISEFKSRL